MYHLIYQTTNLINNKIYVGVHSTKTEEDGYLGSGLNLKRAIKKYGKENFQRRILHYCLTEQQAYEIEIQIVDECFVARKDTYNLCVGGNGGAKIFTEETKKKMSESAKGKSRSEEYLKNMSISQKGNTNCKGRILSNETKKKISNSHKGRKHSEETKKKMSTRMKGNQYNKGIPHSEEAKQKISESLKLRYNLTNHK
jgi:hypothetical protein